MLYFICLFLPSFIGLNKITNKEDKVINIIIKYSYINVFVNLFSFATVWFFTENNSVIDNQIMTISFFVKYLLCSVSIAFVFPYVYNTFNEKFKVEVKKINEKK